MQVELTSDEISQIAIALKQEAKSKVMETEMRPREDQILNAADGLILANRLLNLQQKGE